MLVYPVNHIILNFPFAAVVPSLNIFAETRTLFKEPWLTF